MLAMTIGELLDLRGPAFLWFYGIAAVAGFAVALGLRWTLAARRASHPWATPADPDRLDPYQAAYLNGGRVLAVNAAIADLIARGLVSADHGDATLRRESPGVIPPAHPLPRAVLEATPADGEAEVGAVRSAVAAEVRSVAEELEAAGLVVPGGAAGAARWLGVIAALLVPALGVAKIMVGLYRERPVGYLIAMVIVSLLVVAVFFARRPHRTAAGRAALARMRSARRDVKRLPRTGAGDTIALGVALFGMHALAGTAYADLETTLKPPASAASSGCGGGCGGSCGGGCGGGGCGGCGGD